MNDMNNRPITQEEADYMKWQIYSLIAVIFAVGCVAVLVRWAI